MARAETQGDRVRESDGLGRRGFLRTLAGVGGALAAGIGAWGAAAPARAAELRLGTQGVLTRATTVLRLRRPMTVQQLSRGRLVRLPRLPTLPAPGEPPLPSSRQRLLDALFGAPGGSLRSGDFSLAADALGQWGPSAPLAQVMGGDALAAAYAAGITLTPSGCEFAPDVAHPSAAPMRYDSFQSWVNPDIFGERLCLMTVHREFPGFFFAVLLNTPGPPQSKLSYVVEVSMDPFDDNFESFIISRPAGGPYESADVEFVPTSDGTYMALVELRGSGDVAGHAHTLAFRCGLASASMTYFNWLNVTAL